MAKKSLQEVVKQYAQMGIQRNVIEIAYANVGGESDKVLDEIFKLQDMSNQYPTKPSNPQDEDAQLSKAIQMSISEAKDKKITLQPLNPEQRVRKSGVPVGLKNIGNTCYFNSLLQTYFQNVQLVKTVLSYQIPDKYKKDQKASEGEEETDFKRRQASCRLVENLKILFANMIASDRKYIDPTDVITSVVDDYGNEIPIGDQKDIGQFNLIFLSRIDQGLQLVKKQQVIVPENDGNQLKVDSPSKIAVFGDDRADAGGSRLIHRSSVKIQQNSIINQQFIGNMENSYTNQSHNIHQTDQEQFSLLFVNVKNHELYKALQEITIQHIDDYRNEKGEVVGVQKQSWIKKAPKTLFFQIDRVQFDKETSQQKKINDQFDFPQTFYIDPFLLQNKETALAFQKKVRKLREQKQKYTEALKKLQKFGQKNLSILDILSHTRNFFQHQKTSIDTQQQIQNPTVFNKLSHSLKQQSIALLKTYEQQAQSRINTYIAKSKSIQQQIQTCYQAIKSTPYYLCSVLIHEGSADSGHYYSYTYDLKQKVWRKYNDINISEQTEHQVIKEARGINFTSAYYLVYSQESALVGQGQQGLKLRNYQLSSGEQYLNDYYSSLIPKELKNKIKVQNEQLYLQIEQYKMGGFANRVVDSYVKKFETANEAFRKAKYEKKKNSPPLLNNLPLYLKSLGLEDQYKNALLASAVQQYGPNYQSPVFEDLLKKKMSSFNDFKKPKDIHFNQQHAQVFMSNVYKSISATKLFEALRDQDYAGIFGLVKQLRSGEPSEYFDWLSNLVCKILAVNFLAAAEVNARNKNFEKSIQMLRLMLVLVLNFIKRNQQKNLIQNCCWWTTQTAILLPQNLKEQAEQISQLIKSPNNQSKYDEQYLANNNTNNLINQIKNSTNIQDSLWNLSRSENTFTDQILVARQNVKNKMEVMNNLYKEMKSKNLPLNEQERRKVLDAKKQQK